jgi:hypothetical protein
VRGDLTIEKKVEAAPGNASNLDATFADLGRSRPVVWKIPSPDSDREAQLAVMRGEAHCSGAVAERAPDDPAGQARVTVVNAEDALVPVLVMNGTMLTMNFMGGCGAGNGQRRQ